MRSGDQADQFDSHLDAKILQHPLALTTVILIVTSGVSVASSVTAAAMRFPPHVVEIVAESILAGIAAVLLTRLQLWRTVGFQGLNPPRDLRLYWVPLFPVLVIVPTAASRIGQIGLEQFIVYLALAGLVGFAEEVAFRGLILRSIAHRGPWQAAIISAALFGLMHSLNVFAGADAAAVLLQVGNASAVGFCFAAITLRTGVIWPLVIIHGLTDLAGFVTGGATIPVATTVADLAIYFVYFMLYVMSGVILLRHWASVRPMTMKPQIIHST